MPLVPSSPSSSLPPTASTTAPARVPPSRRCSPSSLESTTLWLTLLLFPLGRNVAALITPYLLHYLHCTLVYPLRLLLKSSRRKIENPGFPASIAAMAFAFNLLNAFIFEFHKTLPPRVWLWKVRIFDREVEVYRFENRVEMGADSGSGGWWEEVSDGVGGCRCGRGFQRLPFF